MKKLILRYIETEAGEISFKIEEQTYRGLDFGDDNENFTSVNGMVLGSRLYPEVYEPKSLACMGEHTSKDGNVLIVSLTFWETVKEAVKEYNEYNGYYGECILGESIEDIVPIEMFLVD